MSNLVTDPRVGSRLTWVSEGQKVWTHSDSDKGYILCVVSVAAGLNARLLNDKRGFAEWCDVRNCFAYVPKKDPTVLDNRSPNVV